MLECEEIEDNHYDDWDRDDDEFIPEPDPDAGYDTEDFVLSVINRKALISIVMRAAFKVFMENLGRLPRLFRDYQREFCDGNKIGSSLDIRVSAKSAVS